MAGIFALLTSLPDLLKLLFMLIKFIDETKAELSRKERLSEIRKAVEVATKNKDTSALDTIINR